MRESAYNLCKRDVKAQEMKKITVRLDEVTYNELKKYCRESKLSLQETLENYIKKLVKEKK